MASPISPYLWPAIVNALLALEHRVFATDRLSRRSFRRFLRSPSATVIVAQHDDRFVGSAIVLFRRGSSIARLYSIAVAPEMCRRGLGARLLALAEWTALGCRAIRLEVHAANDTAISFYLKSGYRQFGRRCGYYGDGGDALRLEKCLRPPRITMAGNR